MYSWKEVAGEAISWKRVYEEAGIRGRLWRSIVNAVGDYLDDLASRAEAQGF